MMALSNWSNRHKRDLSEWPSLLDELDKDNMRNLIGDLRRDRQNGLRWFPDDEDDIFRAFRYAKPEEIRCVIVGQDPYLRGEADGLAFSVPPQLHKLTPSLMNIFSALQCAYQELPRSTNLSTWARDSKVLLLNAALTVEEKRPKSHLARWRSFTSKAVRELLPRERPPVFLLWGRVACNLMPRQTPNNVLALESPHPHAPGFLCTGTPLPTCRRGHRVTHACFHFKETNRHLSTYGLGVDWLMAS